MCVHARFAAAEKSRALWLATNASGASRPIEPRATAVSKKPHAGWPSLSRPQHSAARSGRRAAAPSSINVSRSAVKSLIRKPRSRASMPQVIVSPAAARVARRASSAALLNVIRDTVDALDDFPLHDDVRLHFGKTFVMDHCCLDQFSRDENSDSGKDNARQPQRRQRAKGPLILPRPVRPPAQPTQPLHPSQH